MTTAAPSWTPSESRASASFSGDGKAKEKGAWCPKAIPGDRHGGRSGYARQAISPGPVCHPDRPVHTARWRRAPLVLVHGDGASTTRRRPGGQEHENTDWAGTRLTYKGFLQGASERIMIRNGQTASHYPATVPTTVDWSSRVPCTMRFRNRSKSMFAHVQGTPRYHRPTYLSAKSLEKYRQHYTMRGADRRASYVEGDKRGRKKHAIIHRFYGSNQSSRLPLASRQVRHR